MQYYFTRSSISSSYTCVITIITLVMLFFSSWISSTILVVMGVCVPLIPTTHLPYKVTNHSMTTIQCISNTYVNTAHPTIEFTLNESRV